MSCIFDNFNFLNIGLVCAFLLQVNIRKGLFCHLSIRLNHIPKLSYWITCGTRSVNYVSSSVHCRVIHISICTLELDISSNQMRLQGNAQPTYMYRRHDSQRICAAYIGPRRRPAWRIQAYTLVDDVKKNEESSFRPCLNRSKPNLDFKSASWNHDVVNKQNVKSESGFSKTNTKSRPS